MPKDSASPTPAREASEVSLSIVHGVLSPVSRGSSSSHTTGPLRILRMVHDHVIADFTPASATRTEES